MPKRAYYYDSKIINVGTPGVFHKLHYKRETNQVFLDQTFCGIVAPELRSTAHKLADYQPCVVCFDGWDMETK